MKLSLPNLGSRSIVGLDIGSSSVKAVELRRKGRGSEFELTHLGVAPLPAEDLLREARATGAVLVADETRRTGGVSEGVLTALLDAGFAGRAARVAGEDSFIPLGDAAGHVLLSEDAIVDAARRLLTGRR